MPAESDLPMLLGAFIIPKADPTVPPCWVNDFRQSNTKRVTETGGESSLEWG